MSIRKLPSGRWHARLKSGRQYVAGKTFDTRRDAQAWLARERAAIAGGIDPRSGRTPVRKVMTTWLEERKVSVTRKTYVADAALPRLLPTSIAALQIGAVTDRDVSRALVTLTKQGLAESSVRRFRASLSAFFAWAVRERIIASNPVTRTRVPKVGTPPVEMDPFSEKELEALWRAAKERNERLANILLVAGWTGLRWSELRAVRVRDFVEVPMPLLVIERAAPEGVDIKVTKSGRRRRVPVADRILPIVQELTRGRGGDQLLFVTESGHQLHASALKRTVCRQRSKMRPIRRYGLVFERRRHRFVVIPRAGPSDPRSAPHCRLPVARPRCGSGDGSGLDGPRVDRDHQPLPPPSR